MMLKAEYFVLDNGELEQICDHIRRPAANAFSGAPVISIDQIGMMSAGQAISDARADQYVPHGPSGLRPSREYRPSPDSHKLTPGQMLRYMENELLQDNYDDF